jgi:hypothetical protein
MTKVSSSGEIRPRREEEFYNEAVRSVRMRGCSTSLLPP